ncbi:MAG: hypothetical protein QXF26_01285 [Candidatus Bathyarchaeia archaeon]
MFNAYMVKYRSNWRAHDGFGASSDVRATLMAREGFTGARQILRANSKPFLIVFKDYIFTDSAIDTFLLCSSVGDT